MTTTTVTPKVWIGCLASYNAGRLIGKWADATEGLDALLEAQEEVKQEALAAMKEAGEFYGVEPEEFFLADYEGFPEGTVGEYTPLAQVAELAEAVEEHGDAFAAYLSLGRYDADQLEDALQDFEDCYAGEYDSLRDYAEESAYEIGLGGEEGSVIESLASYIDWDRVARDYGFEGYTEADGHIFRP